MGAIRKATRLALAFAPFFILSCAGSTPPSSARAPEDRFPVATAARLHMDAGEYVDAIDDYSAAHESRPRDGALAKECARSLEKIKTAADDASNRGEFASAGRMYGALLKTYSSFKDLAPMLSFDRARLNTDLSYCKSSLSARGFQEYRKGNLDKAITLWRSLLAFDPDNADIKGALRTATLQQKNLRERSSGR